ncbi:MAG: hypothetical protein JNK37_09370, partial [Verrucomicrobiales bacterium]|nr:hypothetical protein [Verrucomicrobiales bacterium]
GTASARQSWSAALHGKNSQSPRPEKPPQITAKSGQGLRQREPVGRLCSKNIVDHLGLTVLDGTEAVKIIIGPDGTGPNGVPTESTDSDGGHWAWARFELVFNPRIIDLIVDRAKQEHSEENYQVPCTWNNYETIIHSKANPLTPAALQEELSDGKDFYLIALHGSIRGKLFLIADGAPLDSTGKYIKWMFYLMSEIASSDAKRGGPISFHCCHSSGINTEGLERIVTPINKTTGQQTMQSFYDYLKNVVKALCCAARDNDL